MTMTMQEPLLIPIEYLHDNPWQPRLQKDDDRLKLLVETIKKHGFSGSLEARHDPAHPDQYQLVFGHRRREAAELAGMKAIPVVIRDYSDQEMAELALLENHTQEEMTYLEEGKAYLRLIQEFGHSTRVLAKLFDVSKGYIANRVAVAKMPADSPLAEAARQRDADMTTIITLGALQRYLSQEEILQLLEQAVNREIGADQLKAIRSALVAREKDWQLVNDEGEWRTIHTVYAPSPQERAQARQAQEQAERQARQAAREAAYRAQTTQEREAIHHYRAEREEPARPAAPIARIPAEPASPPLEHDVVATPLRQRPTTPVSAAWQSVRSPVPEARQTALDAITQLGSNVRNLTFKLRTADFTLLTDRERAEWDGYREAMMALLNPATPAPLTPATTSRS